MKLRNRTIFHIYFIANVLFRAKEDLRRDDDRNFDHQLKAVVRIVRNCLLSAG